MCATDELDFCVCIDFYSFYITSFIPFCSLCYDFIAIDIIIGGPPCVDYSGVNANRQGVQGVQGQYLLQFGELICDIRRNERQRGNPLFFLCENVPIADKDGSLQVENQFGVSGICIDAKYFSPCKRNRVYFTTVRFSLVGS